MRTPHTPGASGIVISCLAAALPALLAASQLPAAEQPNIIFILADDLGYGDLGCYGQKQIQTPRLDRMAAEGLRFTQHYAGSTVCAPSRCSLLTGLHTGHTPIRGNTPSLLAAEDLTVAELLKAAGYTTACIGKWGVGHPPPADDPARNGFNHFFGYLDMWHAHNYYPDFLWKNGTRFPLKGNIVESVGKGGVAIKRSQYSHDLFTDDALTFIESRATSARPFFLYLAFTIPHANNEAGNEGMEVPSDAPYSAEKWPQAQKNHAAMITRLDKSVGKILDLLDNLKISENTLVIFTSDNGPHREGGANPDFFQSAGGLKGIKRDLYEGGIRVPMIARWTGRIKPGATTGHLSAFWDFLPTAAEIAGAEIPENIDGLSYLPTLLGRPDDQKQHEYFYWEFHERGSVQAVRKGDWKLIRFHQSPTDPTNPTELYNLKADSAEQFNVAAEHPDVIQSMDAILNAARTGTDAFPLQPPPQPDRKPATPPKHQ